MTAHRANDSRGWAPRPTPTNINYATHSKVALRRSETCPEAQPFEVTRRAPDVGTIAQVRKSSIDQLPLLLIRFDVVKYGIITCTR
eukprot:12081817-Alexandrium_andersonii.AAC.1